MTDTDSASALRGHAAMLLFALVISVSFTLGGMAAPHIDPMVLTAARFVIASAVIGAIAARLMRAEHFRRAWRYAILGSLLGVYFILMFEALRITDPVSTGAVFTMTPIMSAAFGWLLLRQVTRPLAAAALAVGGVGALWVIFRGDVEAMLGFRVGLGEQLFFIGCAAHAFYTPLVRKLNGGVPVIVFTFGTVLAGAVVTSAVALPRALETDWLALPGIVWLTIGYLSVCATALTFFLLQYASMRLPSGKVMAYGYLTPSFIAVWEGLVGHGWVPALTWLGLAATLGALAILLKA